MNLATDAIYIDSKKIAERGAVSVLDTTFTIPRINRQRKVWLYLPRDYFASNKRYPVIYMQDGQNLFDSSASFAGEWYVDETLDSLSKMGKESAIVVGIENSRNGGARLDEYSPWRNEKYKFGGQGNLYIDFIVNNLKPYIDMTYRTLSDRENTGIMGSSMGGLISLYGIIERQDVFGKAGVFSPSLWYSGEIFRHVSTTGKRENIKIYLIAGEKEGSNAARDTRRMSETLRNSGFGAEEIYIETHADGQHNEAYWAREFPKAYEWLFTQ